MTTWNKELCLYIDADAVEGAPCLLDGKASTQRMDSPYFIQGDKFTLKVFFRRRSDSSLNASAAVELPLGLNIVFAAKLAANLDSNDLLFAALDFVQEGENDDICYTALLDLNTLEIRQLFQQLSATSANIKIDIEVQNAGNTERSTFQFDAVLKQQVYAGESAPLPGTPVYPLPADLVLKQPDGSFVRFAGAEQNLYIYESTTNLWYPLVIKLVDGIPTLALGEGVSL